MTANPWRVTLDVGRDRVVIRGPRGLYRVGALVGAVEPGRPCAVGAPLLAACENDGPAAPDAAWRDHFTRCEPCFDVWLRMLRAMLAAGQPS